VQDVTTEEGQDRARTLGRMAALIAEKRVSRVQLALGTIDPESARDRVQAADAELTLCWEDLRRGEGRTSHQQRLGRTTLR
jgi:hypothetical protein